MPFEPMGVADQQHGRCGREFAMTKRCEKGQALLATALILTVLMLAAGLAIDIGYLRYQRRRMQTAVDSAAIAGASALLTTTGISDASTAAVNDAGLNGYLGFLDTQVVPGPNSSPYCVQVTDNLRGTSLLHGYFTQHKLGYDKHGCRGRKVISGLHLCLG